MHDHMHQLIGCIQCARRHAPITNGHSALPEGSIGIQKTAFLHNVPVQVKVICAIFKQLCLPKNTSVLFLSESEPAVQWHYRAA
jgi:hypothetical protein